MPQLSSDIDKAEDLDKEIKASGFANEEELKAMENIHEHYLDNKEDVEEEEDEKESDEEADDDVRDRKVRFQEDPELKRADEDEGSDDEEVVADA